MGEPDEEEAASGIWLHGLGGVVDDEQLHAASNQPVTAAPRDQRVSRGKVEAAMVVVWQASALAVKAKLVPASARMIGMWRR